MYNRSYHLVADYREPLKEESKYAVLTEAFIEANADAVNWPRISKWQQLSEAFILKHRARVEPDRIVFNQALSEAFIETHFPDSLYFARVYPRVHAKVVCPEHGGYKVLDPLSDAFYAKHGGMVRDGNGVGKVFYRKGVKRRYRVYENQMDVCCAEFAIQ